MGAILRVGLRMILLNGHAEPRVRNSEGCTVLPCGCAHLEREWVQMCDTHGTEYRERHALAKLEHAARIATANTEV